MQRSEKYNDVVVDVSFVYSDIQSKPRANLSRTIQFVCGIKLISWPLDFRLSCAHQIRPQKLLLVCCPSSDSRKLIYRHKRKLIGASKRSNNFWQMLPDFIAKFEIEISVQKQTQLELRIMINYIDGSLCRQLLILKALSLFSNAKKTRRIVYLLLEKAFQRSSWDARQSGEIFITHSAAILLFHK